MIQRRGINGLGGAVVALSAAAGALVGLRSVVAFDLSGVHSLLTARTLPKEDMGLAWTARALWPAQLQDVALERLAGLLATLFLAAAGVAVLNTLILLFEAGASRRREVAVRAAVGAGPGILTLRLLREVRTLLAAGLALGLLVGLVWGGALRASWPGLLEPIVWATVARDLVPVLTFLMAGAALAFVWTGIRVGLGQSLGPALMSGERATAAPGEVFRRRILAAVQIGAAGAVTLGSLALAMGLRAPTGPPEGKLSTVTTTVRAPEPAVGSWMDLLRRLETIPGLEAESLATPGALVGLGIRTHAIAQCGNCSRGGLPIPFWGAVVDHHAVGPGFFQLAGMTLSGGRDFTASDDVVAPRVVVVNRTFANTAFEGGKPIGRLVRLGAAFDAWYEVVGVVEDQPILGLGGDDIARSAVYLSALQHPMASATLLLSGSENAVNEALDIAATVGFDPGEVRSVDAVRNAAMASMGWVGALGLMLSLLTLALAVHGGHTTALQVARRRFRELAVRRALGATDRRIVAYVLSGAAGTALGGSVVAVFFGALFVALLRKVAGGVPMLGPSPYVGVVVLLVGTSLLASARATREAVAVQPGAALE